MKPTLVILAAGMGSRYGSLKQIDKFGPSGEAIIEYSIFDAIRAGFGKVVFVIRKNIEDEFRKAFGDKLEGKIKVEFVHQELDNLPEDFELPAGRVKPWGTGHAVLVTEDKVNEPFAVINADDFYGADAFNVIAKYLSNLKENDTRHCIIGYKLSNTLSEHGYVSRGICNTDSENNLVDIVERTHIEIKDKGIVFEDENGDTPLTGNEIASMNLMGFAPSVFEYYKSDFKEFIKENLNNLKAEFFMPLIVNNLIVQKRGTVKIIDTTAKWFGVTYKEDKEMAIEKLNQLVKEGVYPNNLWT